MPDSPEGLDRFVTAQDAPRSGLAIALAELRAGHKRSHWIWYVFPQLRGLGSSPMAEHYGIADIDEAVAYLQHPVLRPRLLEAASLVLAQLRLGIPLSTLMGGEVDALKLVSSMTLVAGVARRLSQDDPAGELERLADTADALLAAATGHGFAPCAFTRRALGER